LGKIVIIGFGAAGFAAVTTLRRVGCCDHITVIDPGSSDLLHPCGIPYVLEGEADQTKITQTVLFDRMDVEKIRGRAVALNCLKKTVSVETGAGISSLFYDSLLVCTGSSPVIPLIRGISLAMNKGLFLLSDASDLSAVMAALPGKSKGVVIGGGAIGLEAAVALKRHLASVTVVEQDTDILSGVLDPDMAKQVREELEAQGIVFRLGSPADDIFYDGEFRGLSIDRENISAEIGICAAGSMPVTGFLKEAGIICERNGIVTDIFMKTNAEDVYAAGDCCITRSVIDGLPAAVKLAVPAYRQGVAAALSISGMRKEYKGSTGSFVTKLGSLEVAGTGFTSGHAKERGYDPVMAKITSLVKPEYMNENASVTVKIVAEKKTGRILGAQALGAGAAARINLVSEALQFGVALDRFCAVELAYCPAVGDVIDPLIRAAEGALRRI
jgi:NADH oxidase (H2O2-forming)